MTIFNQFCKALIFISNRGLLKFILNDLYPATLLIEGLYLHMGKCGVYFASQDSALLRRDPEDLFYRCNTVQNLLGAILL